MAALVTPAALLELAAPVWPIAATLAVAAVADRARSRRRRTALNRSLHELRRPLQAVTLAASRADRRPSSLDLALVALDELDAEVNGTVTPLRRRPVSARALVEAAAERWRGVAARSHRSLELRWRAGAPFVVADPVRVAAALDNLIVNAIEHGGLRVTIDTSICVRGVRIAVVDSGAMGGERIPRSRRNRDHRHGHGLEVARRAASAHGGRLLVVRGREGTTAALELPLAPPPAPPRSALAEAGGRNGWIGGPAASRFAPFR